MNPEFGVNTQRGEGKKGLFCFANEYSNISEQQGKKLKQQY